MSVWLEKQLEALERMLSNPSEEPIKLSYPVIQTITKDFAVEIGRGGFGVVYLGSLPGGKIAVKKLSSSQDLDDKLFKDELNCLIRAKHENIVRFLGYCAVTEREMIEFKGSLVLADLRQRILCFEYVPNGNISDYLKAEPSRDEWHMRYQMVRGICQGLNYLHEQLINHLDLKPENVMLDNQWKPKITDFGLSRSFDEGQSRVFTQNIFGTYGYVAPEAIDNGEISYKSDIFSLGIIIIKLLTGRNKYDSENWQNLLDVDGPEAKICIKIAQKCLHADQHKRPTIGEIIQELNELQTGIRNTKNYGTSLKLQMVDFPTMQDKKQYTGSGSAHVEVIDEEPTTVPPNSDGPSLQLGNTHVEVNDEEPTIAPPNSGTGSTAQRVQLVIKSNKTAPLLENKQTVMLELTGGDYTSDRPGLDLVLVVNVSSRHDGKRMEEVKAGMRFVVQKLGPIDRLSVVSCAATEELCPLHEITESARQELLELIDDRIEASSWSNNIQHGLQTGLKVLANRNASAGRVAAIILVSDIHQDTDKASEVNVGNVPVYTFGFGEDSKHTVLSAIAANSLGGTFSNIQDVDNAGVGFTIAIAQCLAGLLTVAARYLELTVAPVGDESRIVKTTAGSYPQTQDGDDSVTIRFGNLYSQEVRKVIVELRLAACKMDQSFEFLKITYSYSSSSSSSSGRERFVRPLTLWRTTHGVDMGKPWLAELHAEKARPQILELIQHAAQGTKSLAQANQMIVEAQKMAMLLADPLLTSELQKIHDAFETRVYYARGGCAYALSFLSSHNRQRPTARGGGETEILHLFATPCMSSYLEHAVNFHGRLPPGGYFVSRPTESLYANEFPEDYKPDTESGGDSKSGGLRLWPWRRRS